MANPHLKLRILFVDDEPYLREVMQSELPRLGHEVIVCPDIPTAVETLKRATFDAAILDLNIASKEGDTSGLRLLSHLKQVSPDTEAVMMTGYASQETTVAALRLGAFDYLTKPCKLADIEGLLLRIVEKRKLKNQAAALQTRVTAAEGTNLLIGDSPAMQPVNRLIATVAPTDATVLITGETGTGKEMVARTLFLKSLRADMPFVPVNCGSLNQNLVESQLFGHRKGAFTGADKDHKGLFEVANGGTLFLDELGELDKNVQVKLLRFLESGEIRRLGDHEPITVDVRVVCATNRDLKVEIAAGHFREDLLFRLNTFQVHLPPLRERRGDIPELARHLLARVAKRPIEAVASLLTADALEVLCHYHWQGNVRELANAMEYAWIVAGGQPITSVHLPHDVRNPATVRPPAGFGTTTPTTAFPSATVTLPFPPQGFATPTYLPPANGTKTLEDVEMEYILQVYAKNNGNKQATAAELGISLKTLYNKLHKYEDERQKRAG